MHFIRYRRVMYGTLCLVYQLVFLHGVIMTTAANDIMDDMGLSPAMMGVLGSVYLYAYAGVMLFSGVVAAWLGPRKTLAALFAVSGFGGLIFAYSSSFEIAALSRALTGMGMAATMTSSFTLFGRWYPPSEYSRVSSRFFAIGGVGTLVGIGAIASFNAIWGWRTVFLAVSLLTLAYALAILLVVRDWPPPDAAELSTVKGLVRERPSLRRMASGVSEVARKKDFWRIVLWFVCLPGMYFAFFGLWAVPYLKDVYGISDGKAGAMVSLVALGFIIGTPLLSWFSDTVIHSYRATAGYAGVVTFSVTAFLIWRIDRIGPMLMVVVILVLGLALNAPNACVYTASRNLFGARLNGIVGGVFGCSAFAGGAVLQIVCGWILEIGQDRGLPPGPAYAYAFVPLLLCGLAGAYAGFTISKESFTALE